MHGRGPIEPEDLTRRLHEARDSLTIGLEDPLFQFVLNTDITTAAGELQAIAEWGETAPEQDIIARNHGNVMLRELQDSLGEPVLYPLS